MPNAEMLAKIARGDGFIAALDQSGGSTPKALKGYGIEDGAWSSDEEMFDLIHQMRSRIITSPSFASGKVIGAILFERTMDGTVAGKPTPQALIDLGIVPFIKIDKGLADEANGVQMMKPMPELTGLLERARQLGVFGTKERSVINLANRDALTPRDEIKFVLADRADYDFARDFTREHELERRVNSVIFSPAFRKDARGARDASHCLLDPQQLAEWILEDGLNVRLGLQIHKFIWQPETKGV